MFEWLNALMQAIGGIFPRMQVCKANHGGVKFLYGKHIREIKPGLYFYWPVVSEVQLLPTARQTLNLESQTLTTSDSYAVTVSVVVVYRIKDVVKAIVETWDIEDTVSDVALRAAVKSIVTRQFSAARKQITGDLQKEITRSCRSALHPFGIQVVDAFLTDFAETSVYRIVGSTSSPPILESQE